MDVFGPGTDPAGLGTLGAPVNSDHVFEYLGENLPPFGNPRAITREQGVSWSEGFQDRYSGKIVTSQRDRFSPNTTTITTIDPIPTVMRDEISSVKNNAQIAREKTQRSVRTFAGNPSADALANQVNADAELRNLQQEAVGLVYESQMDALRATHAAARARGMGVRENIGAFTLPTKFISAAPLKLQPTTKMTSMPSSTTTKPYFPGGGSSSTTTSSSEETGYTADPYVPTTESYEDYEMGTALDSAIDPTKIALLLGGVAAAAVVAFFVMRKR
jgi:ABC-type sugar transport system ATPase subunit